MLFIIPFVYRGWGAFVVFGMGVLALLATGGITEVAHLDKRTEGIVGSVIIFAAGLMTWVIGDWLNNREVVHPVTGERVAIRRNHSLMFAPIEVWGLVMAALGIILLVISLAANNA